MIRRGWPRKPRRWKACGSPRRCCGPTACSLCVINRWVCKWSALTRFQRHMHPFGMLSLLASFWLQMTGAAS